MLVQFVIHENILIARDPSPTAGRGTVDTAVTSFKWYSSGINACAHNITYVRNVRYVRKYSTLK